MPITVISPYAGVTRKLIEKCLQDYCDQKDLTQTAPSLNMIEVAVVVDEAVEGMPFSSLPLSMLIARFLDKNFSNDINAASTLDDAYSLNKVGDWSFATFAERLFEKARVIQAQTPNAHEKIDYFEEHAWRLLSRVLASPIYSPMLWYEGIFFDVAENYRLKGDEQAIEILKRGLAHNLRYQGGNNALNFMRQLAETYLTFDELSLGLNIFAGLIAQNPGDIWTYNHIAISFDKFGLTDLGQQAIQRGLTLLETKSFYKDRRDEEGLIEQFQRSLEEMQNSDQQGREVEASPEAIENLQVAMTLPFDAGQHLSLNELGQALVPNLDQVWVKRPPVRPKLPLPQHVQNLLTSSSVQTPKRNDPCWCGSNKKYKQCHLRLD